MSFTGTFDRSVDNKLRIAIPKRYRDIILAKDCTELYVAPGTDGSLVIHTSESLDKIASSLAKLSPTQKDVRIFRRLFYAQAERVELDKQGRIRIPQRLGDLIQLQGEAVLLGVDDCIELWSKTAWDSFLTTNMGQYDVIAEAAFANSKDPES